MATHKCPYGDFSCGMFGFESLCTYCRRKAELELESRRNDLMGQQERAIREARSQAYSSMAECLVESPKLTLGILGGLTAALVGIEAYSSRKKSKR